MTMKVIKTVAEMREWTLSRKKAGRQVGLVPTMGFLHEGHLSLIRRAKQESDAVVVSIYVNPTQFAPGEDLDRYPRDFKRDQQLCLQEGVDAVFYPDEMYAPDHKTYVVTEELSKILCGVSRPDHFRGVTTIVAKLFNSVQPDTAVFGQKDAQQALIIKRMAADLNFGINIIISPIIRENDGLAVSSRNKYLTPEQRQQAAVLYRSLRAAEQEYEQGNVDPVSIKNKMKEIISEQPLAKIDYIALVNADTLTRPKPGTNDVLAALAVFFDKTRLIDNTILKKRR